jgi:hypothetical protein
MSCEKYVWKGGLLEMSFVEGWELARALSHATPRSYHNVDTTWSVELE